MGVEVPVVRTGGLVGSPGWAHFGHHEYMVTQTSDTTVDAGAEKRFFIEMLTKDIELLPAIVDLVDNSVDGARGLTRMGTWLANGSGSRSATARSRLPTTPAVSLRTSLVTTRSDSVGRRTSRASSALWDSLASE